MSKILVADDSKFPQSTPSGPRCGFQGEQPPHFSTAMPIQRKVSPLQTGERDPSTTIYSVAEAQGLLFMQCLVVSSSHDRGETCRPLLA